MACDSVDLDDIVVHELNMETLAEALCNLLGLARAQAHQAPTDQDLLAMRRATWRKQGMIMFRPEDDWIRQALINEANRLYGRRPGGER